MRSQPKRPSSKLPRKSFATPPVHLRLSEICRKAIVNGDYKPGERFPSERELAERYEVSRATANKAISTLVAEGLLELQKGIGACVCQRQTLFASLRGMESFTSHAMQQGLKPSTIVRAFERKMSASLPLEVQQGLGIRKENPESVIYLERLRLADEIPMIIEHRWIRESLVPDIQEEDVTESFYTVLQEKFGLLMTGEEHSISAALLGKQEAMLFRERKPAAALVVEGSGFIKGDKPIWYQRLYYRADRYKLHNTTKGPALTAVELRLEKGKQTA